MKKTMEIAMILSLVVFMAASTQAADLLSGDIKAFDFQTVTWSKSEEVSSADLRIKDIKAANSSNGYSCKVTVHNYNDDTAKNVTLRVLLPVGVKLLSSSIHGKQGQKVGVCSSSPATTKMTHAYAACALGDINPGSETNPESLRLVNIVTTVERVKRENKVFGAFVWSDIPDLVPGNNYGEATVP